MLQNLTGKGSMHMPMPFDLGACPHDDIGWLDTDTAQCAICARRALCGRQVAFWDDHEEVNIAILVRCAPCVGAEQNDLLRMEFIYQTASHLFE